jgi:cyclophilin family peptidyl-prolyl cis-trans isomerase
MPLNKKPPSRGNATKKDSSDESSEDEAHPLAGLKIEDHMPAPYQPDTKGRRLVLADRSENPVIWMEFHALGGGPARGGGTTKPVNLGRLYFELRNDLCPCTVQNFLTLVTGKNGWGADGVHYHYKGNRVHRILKGILMESGDLLDQRGNCSRSIYNKGGLFKDENYLLRHTGPGCISMCNRGPDTNGSLFQVCLTANPDLDNKYVVFGCLAEDESYNVLSAINRYATDSGRPTEELRIADCGVAFPLPLSEQAQKKKDEEDRMRALLNK